MGRTIRSATQTWYEEEKALARFTRALRREDQRFIAELLDLSRLHIAEASYASNLYPMDVYLISMLLETFKKLRRTEEKVIELCRAMGIDAPPQRDLPALTDIRSLIASLNVENDPNVKDEETEEESETDELIYDSGDENEFL